MNDISHDIGDISDEDLLTSNDEEQKEVNAAIAEISIENQQNDFEKDLAEVKGEKLNAISQMPKIRKKPTPIEKDQISANEPIKIDSKRKRKGLNLATLLQNKVKTASAAKPVDPNSMEGQRELIARRERDLKAVAKQTCIERFNTVDAHLAHWGVRYKICFMNFFLKIKL